MSHCKIYQINVIFDFAVNALTCSPINLDITQMHLFRVNCILHENRDVSPAYHLQKEFITFDVVNMSPVCYPVIPTTG